MQRLWPHIQFKKVSNVAKITCLSENKPVWKFNQVTLTNSSIISIYSRGNYHTIEINAISKNKQGIYECHGRSRNQTFKAESRLIVICKLINLFNLYIQ